MLIRTIITVLCRRSTSIDAMLLSMRVDDVYSYRFGPLVFGGFDAMRERLASQSLLS